MAAQPRAFPRTVARSDVVKHRADIDGLRAIAVLPILLYHAGVSAFSGGFVGVDVFFVISGFLISGIIRDDIAAGRFSIVRFYDRRIRRILPALVFTLALTWAVAYWLLLPPHFEDFSKSVFATGAFISNLYFWKYSGYFENSAHLRPLLHTWSLAVEEQFYIFMPIAMYAVHRFLKQKWLWVFAPAALASLALSIWMMQVGPTANFFLLPTRAWELLLGALLALSPPPLLRMRWANEALGVLGLGLIAFAVFTYTPATPFPGYTALAPCLGAALLIYVGGAQQTLASRLLSTKPMVGVGLISYSLYLVHWPIAVFTRYETLDEPHLPQVLFILALSFALAVFSWRFVEQPFRGARLPMPSGRVLGAGVASLAAVALLGGAGAVNHGFPSRYPSFAQHDNDPAREWRRGDCFFEQSVSFRSWSPETCQITTSGEEKMLLWGDSYAAHYAPGVMARQADIPYRVYLYTFAGCPPVLSYYSYARPHCQEFNQHALQIIRDLHIRHVVLSARWTDLQLRGLDEIRSTLDTLKGMGVTVTVIGQSPMFGADVSIIAFRKPDASSWPTSLAPDLNQRLRNYAQGAAFIDPIASLCAEGRCTYRRGDHFLYADEGHFSHEGSVEAVDAYFPYRRSEQHAGSAAVQTADSR
ncbi:MAG TPA: acyltransferase family protein [Caulobacterales bacterium]|nr:acyltransferase family protein [Caulobacterales bacterium]